MPRAIASSGIRTEVSAGERVELALRTALLRRGLCGELLNGILGYWEAPYVARRVRVLALELNASERAIKCAGAMLNLAMIRAMISDCTSGSWAVEVILRGRWLERELVACVQRVGPIPVQLKLKEILQSEFSEISHRDFYHYRNRLPNIEVRLHRKVFVNHEFRYLQNSESEASSRSISFNMSLKSNDSVASRPDRQLQRDGGGANLGSDGKWEAMRVCACAKGSLQLAVGRALCADSIWAVDVLLAGRVKALEQVVSSSAMACMDGVRAVSARVVTRLTLRENLCGGLAPASTAFPFALTIEAEPVVAPVNGSAW